MQFLKTVALIGAIASSAFCVEGTTGCYATNLPSTFDMITYPDRTVLAWRTDGSYAFPAGTTNCGVTKFGNTFRLNILASSSSYRSQINQLQQLKLVGGIMDVDYVNSFGGAYGYEAKVITTH
ncbi:MAG: hypothetical protein IPK50_00870 [Fibrobacterota bacterium]|nr:MAG: hypothetical protein IPK50_00870 [Fibrobacterota bacterium]